MKIQEVKVRITFPCPKYSESFKKAVVQDYETGLLNKDEIQQNMGSEAIAVFWNGAESMVNCTTQQKVVWAGL